ncbi:zinc-finger domain-containing protein [Falsibacillus albus]|uniref:Zinc-finger domain-containing protein n=1 Tax=Falsibacillus albus TaxID=2478915 RepID=A0A3L7JY27_9BACI|nr:zinc-finger domain-containing protein [Falsibacillus albus]RLQ95164.1 zinc-finger domain-containing protein [Falsibacillus albus]
MKRQEIFTEVEEILSKYCNECFLKAHHRKEYGKSFAHKFCIKQCTVGQQLKKYGDRLS